MSCSTDAHLPAGDRHIFGSGTTRACIEKDMPLYGSKKKGIGKEKQIPGRNANE